jgi:hypothetical protein
MGDNIDMTSECCDWKVCCKARQRQKSGNHKPNMRQIDTNSRRLVATNSRSLFLNVDLK